MNLFSCAVSQLVGAVRALDETILTAEKVSQLLKLVPGEEEELLLLSFEGDVDSLGKVERFFLELLSVPRVRHRLG
mgnify:CR=1 FL=1